MKRVLVDEVLEPGQRLAPEPGESHHLIRVRRAKDGEPVEILDGQGGLALGKVVLNGKKVIIEVQRLLDEQRESPLHMEMAMAVPEHRATIDETLPFLVQLGLNSLYLVPTVNGGRFKNDPEKYLARLRTIALQSLKQCGRTYVPWIEFIPSWEAACSIVTGRNRICILFHPIKEKTNWPEKGDSLGLFIGPEGGFSEDEVAEAIEHGVTIQSMGPRILKTEAAAIAACTQAQTFLGDLK